MRIILVLIICSLFFLGGIYVADKSIEWEQITSVTLILTLIAIIIYTKATVKQTELNLRSFIILRAALAGTSQKYVLVNVGKGPALKIKIENISLIEKLKLIYSFDEVDLLCPIESKQVVTRIGDKVCDDFALATIMPRSASRSHNFVIKYTDINNKVYQTKGKLGKGGIVIGRTK